MSKLKPIYESKIVADSIMILGDSIPAGFGVHGKSYAVKVATNLGLRLVKRAASSRTVKETCAIIKNMHAVPEIVLIGHGGSESLIRPKPSLLKFVPKRYRKPGWLDPIAVFSKNPMKKFLQKIDSQYRWRTKTFLIRFFGGEPFSSEAEYVRDLTNLVHLLKERGGRRLYLIGNLEIDDKYFPGSQQQGRQYFRAASQIAGVIPIPSEGVLDCWGHYLPDHVHLNVEGHSLLANHILKHL